MCLVGLRDALWFVSFSFFFFFVSSFAFFLVCLLCFFFLVPAAFVSSLLPPKEPPAELQMAFQEVMAPLLMQQPPPEIMRQMEAEMQQQQAGQDPGAALGAHIENVLDVDSGEAVPVAGGSGASEDGRVLLSSGALPVDQLPEGVLFGEAGQTLDETQAAVAGSLAIYKGALFSMKHPVGWESSVEESALAEAGARVEKVCFRPKARAEGQSLLVSVCELAEAVSAVAVARKHRKDWTAVHEGFRVVSDAAFPVGEAQDVASFRAGVLIGSDMVGVQHWVGVLDGKWLLDVQEKIVDPQHTIANPMMHQLAVEACVGSLAILAESTVEVEAAVAETAVEECVVAEPVLEEGGVVAAEEQEELEQAAPVVEDEKAVAVVEEAVASAVEEDGVVSAAVEEGTTVVEATTEVSGAADVADGVELTEEEAVVAEEHASSSAEAADVEVDPVESTVVEAAEESTVVEAGEESTVADVAEESVGDTQRGDGSADGSSPESTATDGVTVDDVDEESSSSLSATAAEEAKPQPRLILPYDIEVNPADPHVVALTFHSMPGVTSLRDLKNSGRFSLEGRKVHIAFQDPKTEESSLQSVIEGTLLGTYESFQVGIFLLFA
jgi:hypothetical protein